MHAHGHTDTRTHGHTDTRARLTMRATGSTKITLLFGVLPLPTWSGTHFSSPQMGEWYHKHKPSVGWKLVGCLIYLFIEQCVCVVCCCLCHCTMASVFLLVRNHPTAASVQMLEQLFDFSRGHLGATGAALPALTTFKLQPAGWAKPRFIIACAGG